MISISISTQQQQQKLRISSIVVSVHQAITFNEWKASPPHLCVQTQPKQQVHRGKGVEALCGHLSYVAKLRYILLLVWVEILLEWK